MNRARMLAAEPGLTVPQIALAYALSQPPNLFTTAGSQSREEFATNAAAGSVRLSPADLAWLDLRQESRSG